VLLKVVSRGVGGYIARPQQRRSISWRKESWDNIMAAVKLIPFICHRKQRSSRPSKRMHSYTKTAHIHYIDSGAYNYLSPTHRKSAILLTQNITNYYRNSPTRHLSGEVAWNDHSRGNGWDFKCVGLDHDPACPGEGIIPAMRDGTLNALGSTMTQLVPMRVGISDAWAWTTI
jgi:hypothetical protein